MKYFLIILAGLSFLAVAQEEEEETGTKEQCIKWAELSERYEELRRKGGRNDTVQKYREQQQYYEKLRSKYNCKTRYNKEVR